MKQLKLQLSYNHLRNWLIELTQYSNSKYFSYNIFSSFLEVNICSSFLRFAYSWNIQRQSLLHYLRLHVKMKQNDFVSKINIIMC